MFKEDRACKVDSCWRSMFLKEKGKIDERENKKAMNMMLTQDDCV